MGYRYIGSKSKIVNEIVDKISEIVPSKSTVTDLMCGTASISSALRLRDYNVIANDLMTYSYHHAITALKFYKYPTFNNVTQFINKYFKQEKLDLFNLTPYEKFINALSNVEPIKGYFWNELSLEGSPNNTDKPRNYFSSTNAAKIDGIRKAIKELYSGNCITDHEYSLIQHDVLLAANDIANIAGTYGHHLAKLSGRAKDDIKLSTSNLILKRDTGKHKVYKGYAEKIAKKINCDLCYIDPPYMKRQYAANYHVLETLARGDEPEAIGVSGLRPWRDQYSNFCTKTKIRDSFREIFNNMKCPKYLISYSEDGLLTIEDFIELLTPYGDVYIDEFEHARFRSNNSKLGQKLTEYLICLSTN